MSSIGEVSELCAVRSVSNCEAALQSLDPVEQGLGGCFVMVIVLCVYELDYPSRLSCVGCEVTTCEQILFGCFCVPSYPARIIGNDPTVSSAEGFSPNLYQFLLILRASIDRRSPFSNEVEGLKHGV